MTSQTLIPTRFSELPSSSNAAHQPDTAVNASSSNVCLLESPRSPYQGTHQDELRHLQAETEALLKQLQALKQQRLASTSHDSSGSTHES